MFRLPSAICQVDIKRLRHDFRLPALQSQIKPAHAYEVSLLGSNPLVQTCLFFAATHTVRPTLAKFVWS